MSEYLQSRPTEPLGTAKARTAWGVLTISVMYGVFQWGVTGMNLTYPFWVSFAVSVVGFIGMLYCFSGLPFIAVRRWWTRLIAALVMGALFVYPLVGQIADRLKSKFLDLSAEQLVQPGGRVLGGIEWLEAYVPLKVRIDNNSAVDITDLELTIRPDSLVAKAVQFTDMPNVSLRRGTQVDIQPIRNDLLEPMVLIASDDGYTVACDKLPKGTGLTILFALVHISETTQKRANDAGEYVRLGRLDGYPLRGTYYGDRFSYWHGTHDNVNPIVFESGASASKVIVIGSYRTGYPHDLAETITVEH